MDPMVWLLKNRYGSLELSRQVGPNLLRGLAGSVLLHLLALAALFATVIWNGVEPGGKVSEPSGPVTLIPPWRPVRPLPPIVPELTRPTPPRVIKDPVPVPYDPDAPVTSDPIVGKFGLPGEAQRPGTGYADNPPVEIPPGSFAGIDEGIPPEGIYVPREVEPAPLDINPRPAYPEIPRIAGTSGKVVVNVFVDKQGNVARWRIVTVTPKKMGFEEEVAKVVPKWKFTPAIQQNTPVGVWVSIPFVFSIRK